MCVFRCYLVVTLLGLLRGSRIHLVANPKIIERGIVLETGSCNRFTFYSKIVGFRLHAVQIIVNKYALNMSILIFV